MVTYASSQRFKETLRLSEGGTLTLKDFRGFTVFTVDEKGNVRHKGRMVKI